MIVGKNSHIVLDELYLIKAMDQLVLAERMGGLSESATLALNARAKKMAAEGKTIYNLTAGELATETPEYIQAAVAKTLNLNKYTAVAGMPQLREAIASDARQWYGLDWIESANVVVTAGAKPALYASLLALINPGDEIIVPVPAWVSYNNLVELAGGVVVPVPMTDKFDLDPEAIAAKLTARTKAIIINSPHNPTGAVFSKQALDEVAELLRGRDVTLIADDIYSKLVYDASFTLVPTCGFERLIIVNGFSKSQALTGWRVGYVIADEIIAGAITSLLSHITGNAAVPSQEAALAAMKLHDQPPVATTEDLKRKRVLAYEAIQAMPAIQTHLPGGAFYFFLDLRAITKYSAKWCEDLLAKTGVALVPGEAFSAPGFARLTFVADDAVLTPALERMRSFVTKESQA